MGDGSPKCPTLAVLRVAIDNLVMVINRELGGAGVEVWKFWKDYLPAFEAVGSPL